MSKYAALFLLSFGQALKNTKALIGLSLFLITCLIIFAHLWKMAAGQLKASGFGPQQLLWYIAFNEWILVSIPDIHEEIEFDLKSGRLAYLLPRPLSYLGATFAEALGSLCANLLVLGFVTFLFTWWQAGGLPFPWLGLPVVFLYGLLGGIIALLFNMSIGLSAFWLQESGPFFWIWEKLLFMLGGLMLPLAGYPAWIQSIASFTPFPAILGERSALALNFALEPVLSLLLAYIIWGVLGYLLLNLTFRRGLRILNIGGG
ncbi:MAG: hypothetical protein LW832_06435 [Parachlamydia sp.]|nr:hypothetical protein [Parachlamydia sp.]